MAFPGVLYAGSGYTVLYARRRGRKRGCGGITANADGNCCGKRINRQFGDEVHILHIKYQGKCNHDSDVGRPPKGGGTSGMRWPAAIGFCVKCQLQFESTALKVKVRKWMTKSDSSLGLAFSKFPPVFLAPTKRWRIAAQAAYRPLLVSPAVATAGARGVNMVSDAVDADRHRCPLGSADALPALPLSSSDCRNSVWARTACNGWAPHR